MILNILSKLFVSLLNDYKKRKNTHYSCSFLVHEKKGIVINYFAKGATQTCIKGGNLFAFLAKLVTSLAEMFELQILLILEIN